MIIGIIGHAGSGKTTIFNALTKRSGESVPAGGKISPVLDVVSVPDERIDWLSKLYSPKKTTYAQVKYMDLQGMSASTDDKAGHMATSLIHMRQVDALMLVIRNFTNPLQGKPKIIQDLRHLEDEFILADLAVVEKRLEKLALEGKKGKKVSLKEVDFLSKCSKLLNDNQPLRVNPQLFDDPDFKGFTFLSTKPLLVVINNDEDNDKLPDLSELDLKSAEIMMVRGKLEMELAHLPEDEAEVFRDDYGIMDSALNRVIEKSFSLLQLITFLTVGDDEVKAWTIKANTIAREAAGTIHSDIEKGFIKAEVLPFELIKQVGSYTQARRANMVRLEGKTYLVKDGDIINFRFNL